VCVCFPLNSESNIYLTGTGAKYAFCVCVFPLNSESNIYLTGTGAKYADIWSHALLSAFTTQCEFVILVHLIVPLFYQKASVKKEEILSKRRTFAGRRIVLLIRVESGRNHTYQQSILAVLTKG
jgi:hypothetical protein